MKGVRIASISKEIVQMSEMQRETRNSLYSVDQPFKYLLIALNSSFEQLNIYLFFKKNLST